MKGQSELAPTNTPCKMNGVCVCVDKKHTFLLRYIPIQELTTLVGYVLTKVVSFALNHPHASTYLVTTKCLNVMLSNRHISFGTKLV